ncbi:ABC transporter ATPase [Clostridium botulinum]|uniref:ABC transporter ATPase n=1 Tax=Clostridium botulinum TaxID=1491 RepID=UPI0013F966F1|nr:ABC transporter ATPase [Clostridium botulinum]MBY6915408.1 ABC transporter ATPase [Clostridium botulinum]NFO48525.1 ABC transporter ATPase [Clostridium botulinum]NFQ37700.1 ABC transporter ATPase [Clostridium botulinum]
MKELSTIQKREKLNDVWRVDEKGPGGAYHEYVIKSNSMDSQGNYDVYETIKFQKGARNAEGSQHGACDEDLLEMVRDRLKAFQRGPYSCRENACALTYIEEALLWLNMRKEDRIERNVLGRNEK